METESTNIIERYHIDVFLFLAVGNLATKQLTLTKIIPVIFFKKKIVTHNGVVD